MRKRCTFAFAAVILLLIVSVYTNLITGTVVIYPADILSAISGKITGTMEASVIMNIRVPRIIAAVILGGALALSGYMLQTFFNNPIVGPFVLGISSGAKFTVALALIFFFIRRQEAGGCFTCNGGLCGCTGFNDVCPCYFRQG